MKAQDSSKSGNRSQTMTRICCSGLALLLSTCAAVLAAEGFPQGTERPPIPNGNPQEGVAPTRPGFVPAQTTDPAGYKDRVAAKEREVTRLVKIVEEYLAPVTPAEPTAEQKAAAAKAIADFASQDFETREKASAEVLKLGPAAIAALREAGKSKDAEVAKRAAQALSVIEGRPHLLKQMQEASRSDLNEALDACGRTTLDELRKAEAEAAKDESGKLAGKVKELKARLEAINGLRGQFGRRGN
jgi:hypothetical protein